MRGGDAVYGSLPKAEDEPRTREGCRTLREIQIANGCLLCVVWS